jgi:hypothetical protein
MRSSRWSPGDQGLGGLIFEGSPALLRGLDNLILRPRLWWRETLLPIIFLVCTPNANNPIDGLADRFRQAKGVPYSRIDERQTCAADSDEPSCNSTRMLLDSVVADLSQSSGRGRPLKFHNYSLAVWLESLLANRTAAYQADQSAQRVDKELKKFFRERYKLKSDTTKAEISLIDSFPWWVRFLVLLFPPLGIRLMQAFWRPPKWTARNRISARHVSDSFRGLARKFMEQGSKERDHGIQRDEVAQLLVDAFLEDLRRSYRRITLLGFGRRRTAYPVLLIDKIRPATAGLHLLEAISDSWTENLRNNTGPGRQPRQYSYFHPLLIIAQGDTSALDSISSGHYVLEDRNSIYPAADFEFAYNIWHKSLTDRNRTWFLPIEVLHGSPVRGGIRTEIISIPTPAAPASVMSFIAAAVFISGIGFSMYSTYYTHCGSWYWEPQLERKELTVDRTQCIGLGPSNHRFFRDLGDVYGIDQELANSLQEVEAKLHQTNELAVKDPKHLTIVYMSELSSEHVSDYRTELESLRGIAVAQEETRRDRPVRILLANAGDGMDYGGFAAEAVAKEARRDESLVAVIGLGISRQGTRDAILRLAQSSIPTIGTLLSATDLATKTSTYYHQVGPTNAREAAVSAFYAKNQLAAQNATVFYSGDRYDLYSNDLKNQAKIAFEAQGMTVITQPYRIKLGDDGDDIRLLGRSACAVGPNGVVFYAGRAEHLSSLLRGMQSACEGNYPKLLGGDSLTRFVLDGELSQFPGVTLDYLSFASSLAWGPDCRGANDKVGFFRVYKEFFGEDACTSTRDGTAIVAYDTLRVFGQGVQNTLLDRPSGDAVLAGIANISSEGLGGLHGASGLIDYARRDNLSTPRDKAILILRGNASLLTPKRILLCGQLDTAQPPPDDDKCPPPLDP